MSFVTDTQAPAVLFPGQGSQTPEMRDHVARLAPDLLERVTELVGEDPFPRVEESTRFAQPAIFCASVTAYDALGLEPGVAAGPQPRRAGRAGRRRRARRATTRSSWSSSAAG